jgi:hypothetical protein
VEEKYEVGDTLANGRAGEPEMPAKIYRVALSEQEKAELEGITRKGRVGARKMK